MEMKGSALLVISLLWLPVLLNGQILFREVNQRLTKLSENDRRCDLKLTYEDRYLTTPEIISKYGLPSERHWTTTEDGYILELHRIPAPGKHVVFLMHGIFSTSRDWVINCERRALAFKLYDAGYDVWLGNYRGNTYCRNHTTLKDDDPKFWDFSIDQVGYYDGPAILDYILGTTGREKLSYVGYSMGNGVALTMLLSRPEYNAKVNLWVALAAAVDLRDTEAPILRLIAPFYRQLERFLVRFNHGAFTSPATSRFLRRYLPRVCRREGIIGNPHGRCASNIFLTLDGYDPGQVPPELISIYVGDFPSTMSAKFVTQWFQWIISGNFTNFDEGSLRNMRKYGDVKPRWYDRDNLNTDVVLFWAENDLITTKKSVQRTLELGTPSLLSKIRLVRVNYTSFNHFDYILGKDADIYVYNPLLKILEDYDTEGTTAEESISPKLNKLAS